jgi:hypothetical protein
MAYLEQTQITDERDAVVNPASEESVVLLRRIAKLLESLATVDPQQRQRIALDTIAAGTTLPTVTTVGTVTTVTGVTTVSTVGSVTNIAAVNGWNQQMFADPARNAYNTGIRSQLTFT